MNDQKYQDMPLSTKADAAFRQVAKKVIQQARQTTTPVVIWEEGHIKEIPEDQIKTMLIESQLEDNRP